MNHTNYIKPLFSWLDQLSESGETAIIDDVQLSDDPSRPGETKVILKLSDGQFRFVRSPYISDSQRYGVRTSLIVAFSGAFEVAKAVRGIMRGFQGAISDAESVCKSKH